MAQEADKTSLPQVMVKQETLQQLTRETLDPTAMVKKDEWDLDKLDYSVYDKCFIDSRLRVKHEESHDDLFLKKQKLVKTLS